jgi:GTPase SAR1 family protein
MKNPHKIALCGLDNAGKSSLMKAMESLYGFEEEILQLRPTSKIKYYKRNIFNDQFIFWEFGGQKKYRDSYLESPKSFASLSGLIYLIDIQDEDRFFDSIDYFSKILDSITDTKSENDLPIYVCFSKTDKGSSVYNKIQIEKNIEMLKDLLNSTLTSKPYVSFASSIYDLYSIINLFSSLIRIFSPVSMMLTGLLTQNSAHGFNKALILDNQGLAVLDYVDPKIIKNSILSMKINEIIGGYIKIFRQFEISATKFALTEDKLNNFRVYTKSFYLSENPPLEDKKNEKSIIKKFDPFKIPYYIILMVDNIVNEDECEDPQAINKRKSHILTKIDEFKSIIVKLLTMQEEKS